MLCRTTPTRESGTNFRYRVGTLPVLAFSGFYQFLDLTSHAMKRRALLATLGAAAVSGCLADDGVNEHNNGNQETDYEQCERTYIGVHFDLPDAAREEAIAAIEGEYTTAAPVLPQAMDIEESYLTVTDDDGIRRYYTVETESAGDGTRLRARETLPETTPVSVRNDTETDVTVETNLSYEATMDREADVEHEGSSLLAETVSIEPSEEIQLDADVQYRYGMYHAEILLDELQVQEELGWRMWHEYSEHGTIHIDPADDSDSLEGENPDRDVFYNHASYHPEGEMQSCEWSDEGELVTGPGS